MQDIWLTYHRQVLQAGYDHAQLQWLWQLYLDRPAVYPDKIANATSRLTLSFRKVAHL